MENWYTCEVFLVNQQKVHKEKSEQVSASCKSIKLSSHILIEEKIEW